MLMARKVEDCPVSATPDVTFEFGEGQWHVAVRTARSNSCLTHERRKPGFDSPEAAADAALSCAAIENLTVASREEMVLAAENTLECFAGDESGFSA